MSPELLDDPVRLIKRIAGGDREAFGRFYDRYAALVFTLAMRSLRARAEAEDLLQEVLLQVWRQAGTYRPDRGSPEAWLITITRSRAIDRLRSIRRSDRTFVAADNPPGMDPGGAVDTAAGASEARLIVSSVLASLPAAQRMASELAYFDGFTQSEIAARLGEPLGTVKTRMRAGLAHLRNLLGTKGGGKTHEPRHVA